MPTTVIEYPTNPEIADVALVTTENNQVWHYWCTRLGVETVRAICAEVAPEGKAPFSRKALFSRFHPRAVELANS